MAVKTIRTPISEDNLSPLWRNRVEEVTRFVNKRGYKPTSYENVCFHLGYTMHAAWQALDCAWDLGLIVKEGNGQSCYWRRRKPNEPSFIRVEMDKTDMFYI